MSESSVGEPPPGRSRWWSSRERQKAFNLTRYDFLDFGASKGGCIEFAKSRLGGKRGLGIDIDPGKVEAMRALGYDCIEGDVCKLDLPRKSVRFVTMSHFLEHLPDLAAVRKAIESAARVATHFIFIQGPFFDADDDLRAAGLKFYWSDWSGHPCRLTTAQLAAALRGLGLAHYLMLARVPVKSSLDPAIHPLASPRNALDYVAGTHPPKPFVEFDPMLYREMVCLVRLRRFLGWRHVVQARNGCHAVGGTLPLL